MPNWYSYCINISSDDEEQWNHAQKTIIDSFMNHDIWSLNQRIKVTKYNIVIHCTAPKNIPINWAYRWFQMYNNITIDIGYSDVCDGLYGTWINNVSNETKFITCDWKGIWSGVFDKPPNYEIMSEQYGNHLKKYDITPSGDS